MDKKKYIHLCLESIIVLSYIFYADFFKRIYRFYAAAFLIKRYTMKKAVECGGFSVFLIIIVAQTLCA